MNRSQSVDFMMGAKDFILGLSKEMPSDVTKDFSKMIKWFNKKREENISGYICTICGFDIYD